MGVNPCGDSDAGSDCNLAMLTWNSTGAIDVNELFCILSQKLVHPVDEFIPNKMTSMNKKAACGGSGWSAISRL